MKTGLEIYKEIVEKQEKVREIEKSLEVLEDEQGRNFIWAMVNDKYKEAQEDLKASRLQKYEGV